MPPLQISTPAVGRRCLQAALWSTVQAWVGGGGKLTHISGGFVAAAVRRAAWVPGSPEPKPRGTPATCTRVRPRGGWLHGKRHLGWCARSGGKRVVGGSWEGDHSPTQAVPLHVRQHNAAQRPAQRRSNPTQRGFIFTIAPVSYQTCKRQ